MSYIRLVFTLDLIGDKKSTMVGKTLSRQPLYAQIKQLLTQRICAGEWSAAEALPSEWELAEQMSVSQGTVRKALTELVGEGVLYRQQGRGTFIAEVASDWEAGRLLTPGLFDETPDSLMREFLGLSRVNAHEEMADALGLRRGAALHRIRQLWRLRGRPVALDDVYLPAERFEELESHWLRTSTGVYAMLQQRFGVRVKLVSEQFRAIMLPREEASLLEQHGASLDLPVLSVLRLSSTVEGERIEWRERYCLTQDLAYTVMTR